MAWAVVSNKPKTTGISCGGANQAIENGLEPAVNVVPVKAASFTLTNDDQEGPLNRGGRLAKANPRKYRFTPGLAELLVRKVMKFPNGVVGGRLPGKVQRIAQHALQVPPGIERA